MFRLGFFILLLLMVSCFHKEPAPVSFYHWQTNAVLVDEEQNALEQIEAKKLYLHYFDVDQVKKFSRYEPGAYPIAVLKKVSDEIKSLDVIPVVYIVNDVFKEDHDLLKLSAQIRTLITDISLEHFGKKPKEIQLDCDWTGTTQAAYFELIELLQKEFEVSVTIRLHQIKYKEETGVPPVSKGALMVYNVGALDDFEQNSILESQIVGQYINKETTYPLKLDVALPLFSQMVVLNNKEKIKLMTGVDWEVFQSHPQFLQKTETVFEVVADTLYRGLYLYEGFKIKMEESLPDEIVASYNIVQNSSLNIEELIFYHLDKEVLKNIDLPVLLDRLN